MRVLVAGVVCLDNMNTVFSILVALVIALSFIMLFGENTLPDYEGFYVFLSGVMGAAIAAAAAYLTTRAQLKNSKEIDIDRRIFDARSKAFNNAMRLINFLCTERVEGRLILPTHPQAIEHAGYDVMGQLNLYGSEALLEKARYLFRFLSQPIAPPQEAGNDKEKVITARNVLLRMMRSELGIK